MTGTGPAGMKRKLDVSANVALCICGKCRPCVDKQVQKAFDIRGAVVSAVAWQATG